MKRLLLLILTLVVFGTMNAMIVQKEGVLRSGRRVLLKLAPVDPRSLMQGDYMILQYEEARVIDAGGFPRDGRLVIRLDENEVARVARLHHGEALGPGEARLKYRRRRHSLRLGAESFFFQEGDAEYYQGARYGDLRVAPDGSAVLVGLCDATFRRLGPPRSR